MTCENCSDKFGKTAENGWVYDETVGAKVKICEYPVRTFSLNSA